MSEIKHNLEEVITALRDDDLSLGDPPMFVLDVALAESYAEMLEDVLRAILSQGQEEE